jgi:RNA polymerase sigma factor (sigma-70 family)
VIPPNGILVGGNKQVEMGTRLSVEDLIGHGAWARNLAAHLVRDSASADDLAQEAWMAGAAGALPEKVSVRAWMTGVLRNLARMGARAEARRRRREQEVAAASVTASDPVAPDRLLANVELHRILAELVATLREPLRSTVLLRYHEGKSSAQIAREQGVPEGTVRRRLKEGLDELRAMLAERYGAERWGLLVAPFASSGNRRSPATAAGPGMAALTKGVAAFTVTVLAAGTGVLVTWWSWQQRRPPIAAQGAARPPALAAVSPSPASPDTDLVQGEETAMKMNRLRTAAQAIALAAGSASAAPGVEVRGSLEKDAVERVVADHINEVKWCYEQERAKNPQLRGRVSVQFTIAETGAVSESKVLSATTANAPLETCVARCPRRWQFPKPGDSGPVTVTYPFELPLRE